MSRPGHAETRLRRLRQEITDLAEWREAFQSLLPGGNQPKLEHHVYRLASILQSAVGAVSVELAELLRERPPPALEQAVHLADLETAHHLLDRRLDVLDQRLDLALAGTAESEQVERLARRLDLLEQRQEAADEDLGDVATLESLLLAEADGEEAARDVHQLWLAGMLSQQRPVRRERTAWETLPERDRAIDRLIARAVIRRALERAMAVEEGP